MKLQNGKTIMYEPDPTKFDLVVDRWDHEGRKIYHNPYRKFMRQDAGDVYERPKGSGNLWYENNQPAGRVQYEINEKGHIHNKKFLPDAPHVEYTPPATPLELSEALTESKAALAAAQAELAAIKREAAARTAPAAPTEAGSAAKQAPSLSKPQARST